LFALVELDKNNELVASNYAKLAKDADLDIIAWTLERSGPLAQGGGWYYKSVKDGINNDGDMMKMLDVLAQDVGVMGVF
ncbi:glycerophosphodiester phosphodiesterase, partial [Vibrio sp. 10N.222.52.B7]